jgi:hypothetical protein
MALDRKRLVASGLLAVGVVGVVVGVLDGTTGDDRVKKPSAIEAFSPAPDGRVLAQDSVIVDLQAGFTGVLIIDGVQPDVVDRASVPAAAAGEQATLPPTTLFDSGSNVLSFTPGEGALIESFAEGEHTVIVRWWAIADGPSNPQSFSWTFSSF